MAAEGSEGADRQQKVRGLSDGDLKDEIARMFSNWCWISGDPEEKTYYGLLLEEAERRKTEKR